MKRTLKRFAQRHFSQGFILALCFSVTALFTPVMFSTVDFGELVTLKGHFSSLRAISGARNEDDASFEFRVREFPRTFRVVGMRSGDQIAFTQREQLGNEVEFSVQKQKFDDLTELEMRAYMVKTESRTYLTLDDLTAVMRSNRLIAIFLGLLGFGVGAWFAVGLWRRYQSELANPGEEYFDPTVVAAARICARLHLKWLREALAWSQNRDAEARRNRIETQAPTHVKELAALLKEGGDINAVDKDGRTALHRACLEGRTEAVDHLIRSGADVNVVDKEDRTALMLAVSAGHLGVVLKFIDRKADLLFENKAKETALSLAENNKKNPALVGTLRPAVKKAETEAGRKTVEAIIAAIESSGSGDKKG